MYQTLLDLIRVCGKLSLNYDRRMVLAVRAKPLEFSGKRQANEGGERQKLEQISNWNILRFEIETIAPRISTYNIQGTRLHLCNMDNEENMEQPEDGKKTELENVIESTCTGQLKPNPIYQKLMVENLTIMRPPILKLYYWESFDITG